MSSKNNRVMIETLLDMGIARKEEETRLNVLLRELDKGYRLKMTDEDWLTELYLRCIK